MGGDLQALSQFYSQMSTECLCVHRAGPGVWDMEQASPSCMLTVACVGRRANGPVQHNLIRGEPGGREKGPRLSCEGGRKGSGEVPSTGHGGAGREEKGQGERCRPWALRGAMGGTVEGQLDATGVAAQGM